MCGAGLVGGRPHADYLARLGMAREAIFQGYDAVDNDYFARNRQRAIKKAAGGNPAGAPVAGELFFGERALRGEKNLLNLDPRLCALPETRRKTAIAGAPGQNANNRGRGNPGLWYCWATGRLRSAIFRSAAPRSDCKNCICICRGSSNMTRCRRFTRWQKFSSMPAPSEQWGLVVNEAMASGLPVLVSKRCGCAADLVREGVNGFVFRPL